MERIAVAGGHLEGWESGAGEPVLLIHGAMISDEWGCILEHPALAR